MLEYHLQKLAQRVAQHEFGHYIAAVVLGFQTGGVSIELLGVINGHKGCATIILPTPIQSLADVQQYLERRIQILFAGAMAETLKPYSPDKSVDQVEANKILEGASGAEQDFAKARELIHLLRDIRYAATPISDEDTQNQELKTITDDLWEKTILLVEQHYETITGLAANLASRVERIGKVAVLDAASLQALPAVKDLLTKSSTRSKASPASPVTQ